MEIVDQSVVNKFQSVGIVDQSVVNKFQSVGIVDQSVVKKFQSVVHFRVLAGDELNHLQVRRLYYKPKK